MNENFSLRPATQEDLPLLLEIENRVNTAPWSVENFRAELAKPYSQVLVMTDDETDSKIAGYIVFWILFEECQILNVAVDLPFRGLGLAKNMVRKAAAVSEKAGIARITLEVRKSNTPAIQLYQGLKFAITSVRKTFYSNGEDAYQMALSLVEDGVEF